MRKLAHVRKALIIVLVFLVKTSVISQVVFSDWIVTFGKKGWDIVNSMICDSSGNIYITGSNTDSIKPGKTANVGVSIRKFDFLAKYDTSGKLVWVKKIRASIPGYGSLLATTSDGRIILASACDAPLKKDKPEIKKMDFFLCGLDKKGDPEWTQTFSGSKFDYFTSLTVDPVTNHILLGGYFYDSLTIQNSKFVSSGKSDAIFLRFDSNGKLETSHQIGGKGDDRINAITTDNLGNAFVTGTFQKKIRFADKIQFEVSKQGETGVFLAKYSVSGELISAKFLCSGKNTLVNSVATNGHLCLVAGSFQDFLTINNQKESSRGSDDVFAICLDNNANLKWYKHIGGTRKDRACEIRFDNKEVILSGSFCSKLMVDNISITSKKESSDIFILSLDTTGKVIWARQIGGKSDDYPKGMKITKDHYIYITGSYRDTLNVGEKSIQSKGEEDVFIGRLENCSLLAPKFKKPESFCQGSKLTLDAGKGFDSYNWNNGQSQEQLFTVDDGGSYPLIRVSRNGCILYDTVEVTENLTPEIFIGNDTTINDTSYLVLRVPGKYKEYLWSNGRKDAVNVIRGFDCREGSNTVWLQVKDSNGCQGYDEMVITVKKTIMNAASESLANSCNVFPNPTNDVLNIYFTTDLENLNMKIFNQIGIEVAEKSITKYVNNTPIIFKLGSFSPGIYTLSVKTKNGFTIKKIVLQ
ncbi:MAG: T9SS C-terminal target domain-containing protein [Bacteroidetes bacterium]|nr:MAG: T9SS C-terminal target domain-containing protein [Bacteroidota bacterium]